MLDRDNRVDTILSLKMRFSISNTPRQVSPKGSLQKYLEQSMNRAVMETSAMKFIILNQRVHRFVSD
jgi:hypothetical protein